MKKQLRIQAESQTGMAGLYSTRVMNADGTPASEWSNPEHNLILPAGFNTSAYHSGSVATVGAFKSQCFGSCHAGTGSTPNKATIDGTYSQSGTTVVRATGTGTFISGNVNDFIKFATGERARIVSVTNTLTVVVDRSQTVAAAALTIYDTSRTLLDTWAKATTTIDGSVGFTGDTLNNDAGTLLTWVTYNFAIETVAATYTEVAISGWATAVNSTLLFSRVVMDTPVPVAIGQFLQLRFELLCQVGNYRTSSPITMAITGWPFPYQIQSITANGTYWDVVVHTACNAHYATGRPIIIAGALPATRAITSISSTVTEFTVTTGAAHGKIAGDSIVIAGSSIAGYNNTWTVATAPTGTTLTVTSGANLGAATGGTLRLATPGTWYNGTYTIASFPNSTTIRITNAAAVPAAGVAGTVTNSLAASAIIAGVGGIASGAAGVVEPTTGSGSYKFASFVAEANMKTGLQYGVNPSGGWTMVGTSVGMTAATYDAINRKRTFTVTFTSAIQNSQTIRQFGIDLNPAGATGCLVVTFDERQRKDNGFQMVFNYTVSWEPDLA